MNGAISTFETVLGIMIVAIVIVGILSFVLYLIRDPNERFKRKGCDCDYCRDLKKEQDARSKNDDLGSA